jgi:hypothetical protein
MTVEQLEERESTEQAVLAWRLEQLRRVGYDRREARLLSRRLDVDLHQAIDLLRNGCPRELALAILL